MEPSVVSDIEIVKIAQMDGDMASGDVGDTPEEDDPTPSKDNPKQFGSAANPKGQRMSH